MQTVDHVFPLIAWDSWSKPGSPLVAPRAQLTSRWYFGCSSGLTKTFTISSFSRHAKGNVLALAFLLNENVDIISRSLFTQVYPFGSPSSSLRKRGVYPSADSATSSGVPSESICPPPSPPSGPMSII